MVRVNIHEQILRQRAGLTGWKAWLAMAASLVVGVTLFLLAASLALILIPVIAIAGAAGGKAGSPRPVGVSVVLRKCTSTTGVTGMRASL